MSDLLTAEALVDLSVSALEEELKNSYPLETINEALGMEAGKTDSRKTAIEALEDASEDAEAKATADAEAKATADAEANATAEAEALAEATKGHYVADGKSVTSLKGIRGEGVKVEAKHFPGGQKTLDSLVTRKLVVLVK